jgi:hypothetical protein
MQADTQRQMMAQNGLGRNGVNTMRIQRHAFSKASDTWFGCHVTVLEYRSNRVLMLAQVEKVSVGDSTINHAPSGHQSYAG